MDFTSRDTLLAERCFKDLFGGEKELIRLHLTQNRNKAKIMSDDPSKSVSGPPGTPAGGQW